MWLVVQPRPMATSFSQLSWDLELLADSPPWRSIRRSRSAPYSRNCCHGLGSEGLRKMRRSRRLPGAGAVSRGEADKQPSPKRWIKRMWLLFVCDVCFNGSLFHRRSWSGSESRQTEQQLQPACSLTLERSGMLYIYIYIYMLCIYIYIYIYIHI